MASVSVSSTTSLPSRLRVRGDGRRRPFPRSWAPHPGTPPLRHSGRTSSGRVRGSILLHPHKYEEDIDL